MSLTNLKIMVLYGGPDKEREVSLLSVRQIAQALEKAGHEVILRDITPDNTDGTAGLVALDEFFEKKCDIVFPALHGKWGEGGGLQQILEKRQIPYVGTRAKQAALCMDKYASKLIFAKHKLPTPEFELFNSNKKINITPPAVVKPANEGSSIALNICSSTSKIYEACQKLRCDYKDILIEKYIPGRELTVGIIDNPDISCVNNRPLALPVIEIIPEAKFYDYKAKYESQSTRYSFDIDLPKQVLDELMQLALQAHKFLGAQLLSRVDFMVDSDNKPWILELNTMPGFTSHSLLPMAAKHANIQMPQLVDKLAGLAYSQTKLK